MTVGSTGPAQTDAPGTTSIAHPGLDVIEPELRKMVGGAVGESVAEVGVATQAGVDAVDTLVVYALEACLAEKSDTMASLVATIAERHLRDGVSRAMSVLGAVVDRGRGCAGKPCEDVELVAPACVTRTVKRRLVLVRSARLASEFLTATLNHDEAGLAATLRDMRPENFEPVLSILVTYAAGLLDATAEVWTQVEAALGRQLCLTQT